MSSHAQRAAASSAVRTAPLRFAETMPFLRFTYPAYQQTLWLADDAGPVGAWVGDEPAGLAMTVKGDEDGLARICSIFVDERFRRRGIGTAPLARLEESQHRRGIRRLELGHRRPSESAVATQRMLDRLGWPPAAPERLLCTCDRRMLEAAWMKVAADLPPDCEIVSWSEITRGERLALVASQVLNPWIPPSLNPFNYEDTMEFNSVGLRCRGEVFGWVLTQRFDATTLIYSCSYMRPDQQRRGRMVPLYQEAIRRHGERMDLPNACWAVPHVRPLMVRFVRRRMASCATLLEDYCVSIKPIPSTEPAA
jgi:GNAT superfamily N-acetyltransferase